MKESKIFIYVSLRQYKLNTLKKKQKNTDYWSKGALLALTIWRLTNVTYYEQQVSYGNASTHGY